MKRMKELEDENRRLKKMYAEEKLKQEILKEAVVEPSQRKEMAREAHDDYNLTISLVCEVFSISETCYRYQPKLSTENEEIADWLLRLTTTHKRWGFGLCFLYLRNIKGYQWNHKRVYRIYRELELNLRIKRIKRDKPDALSVPVAINQVWSMDFMSDTLKDGRSMRTFKGQPLSGMVQNHFGMKNTLQT